MKRDMAPGEDRNEGDEHLAKRQRRESCSSVPVSVNKPQQKPTQTQLPQQPLLEDPANKKTVDSELQHAAVAPCLLKSASRLERRIFNWIPRPPEEAGEFVEIMTSPLSKKPRTASTGTSILIRDPKAVYRDFDYETSLQKKGCFMDESAAGPLPEDIALCERLIQESQSFEAPQGTSFDGTVIKDFHAELKQDHSEAQLMVELHPLVMPSIITQAIRGDRTLKYVNDDYNQSWIKTDPIHGPNPQPDHARGLKLSAFSDSEQRKLGIKRHQKSLYAARENMLFPYLAAEVESGDQDLEFADRANMHSMCIALRAVVSLAQAAGCPEKVNRKILAFSISHELEDVRIYGYYPEIDESGVKYFRWPIRRFHIWMDQKWTCYRFVENLNREFLPLHIDRLKDMLETIPEPEDDAMGADHEYYDEYGTGSHSQMSEVRPRPQYLRTPSSQNHGLQPELRSMVLSLQQKLDQQETEHIAQLDQQKAREEKLSVELAQLKQLIMGQGSK